MTEEDARPLDPLRVFGRDVGIALSERKVPDDVDSERMTAAQSLEATAVLLDRLDDATDVYLAAHGDEHRIDRAMQRTLRALAAPRNAGDLGISFNTAGSVVQALGAAAVERGRVTRQQVVDYLSGPAYDEMELWDVVGPLVDKIESKAADLPPGSPLQAFAGNHAIVVRPDGTVWDPVAEPGEPTPITRAL